MLLVVEDDPLALRAVLRVVQPRKTAIATSAAEALDALTLATPWSGILLDAGLPEGALAGIELLGAARTAHPTVPSAIMTGNLDRRIVQACADLDAAVILKPDVLGGLSHLLRRIDERVSRDDVVSASRVQTRYGLTPREAELVSWLAAGRDVSSFLSHARIARSTFKTHRENILRKRELRAWNDS